MTMVQEGDRIELVSTSDPNTSSSSGDQGTVQGTSMTTVTPREFTVLSLLANANWILKTKSRFHILTFRLDEQLGDDVSIYEYETTPHGPYSSELESVLTRINGGDFIHIQRNATYGGDTRYSYHLTSAGEAVMSQAIAEDTQLARLHDEIGSLIESHGDTPVSNLIHNVADEYPQYFENPMYT